MNTAVMLVRFPKMTRMAINTFFFAMSAAITDLPSSERSKFWGKLLLNVEAIGSTFPEIQTDDQEALRAIFLYLERRQFQYMEQMVEMPEEEQQAGQVRRRVIEQLLDIVDS